LDDKIPSVLIVDDEQAILDSLEDLLEDDFEVITTTDPRRGLEMLRSREIGVVLSDQRMPTMQGHEFLSEVSRFSRATRMLITGYTDMDALVNAVNRSQIFAFVAKPWEPGHLRSLVQTAMEHFRLARELFYEKHLMESLMDTVPDPIFFLGKDGALLRANRAAQDLLGVSDEEQLVGRTTSSFVKENPTLKSLLERGPVGTRTVVRVETLEGGTRWHSTIKVPFGQEEGVISVSHDITERHQAEMKLAKQAFALEHSYRELHQFAHVTSHHLQEPLRDVVSHLQLLGHRMELTAEEHEILNFAVGGARRMKTLFSDFIRYIDFNEENCALEKVDLKQLWSSVLAARKASLEKMECSPRIPDFLPAIQGRRVYLNYLFEEILENSIKFSDSPLEFSVEYEESPTEYRLLVSDNGVGVEQEELEVVFGLFQRLHPVGSYKGTGLGLALCRKIMRLHNGEIWARTNHPAPGITLVLVFPRRVKE